MTTAAQCLPVENLIFSAIANGCLPVRPRYLPGTIVVCLDGTGDKFNNDNSNIVHFVGCLKKDDKTQVTYYQAGIGTYSAHGLSTPASKLPWTWHPAVFLAFMSEMHTTSSCTLTERVTRYAHIFGFSRGAYTARCLAGMVHKVGLLPPRNNAQIHFAYDMYRDDRPEGWKQSAQFKEAFCMDVGVYFLGLFDNVASACGRHSTRIAALYFEREPMPLFQACFGAGRNVVPNPRSADIKTKDTEPQDSKSSTPATPTDASPQCQPNGFVPGHRPPECQVANLASPTDR